MEEDGMVNVEGGVADGVEALQDKALNVIRP